MIRAAITVSGLPRFRADTDTLINNLTNADIDWYFSFWKHKPTAYSEYDPKWQELSETRIVSEIQSRLGPRHRIRFFEWVHPNSLPPMPRDYPAFYNIPINCYQQYILFNRINNIRKDYERVQAWKYDLLIRGRVDAGSDRPLDLDAIAEFIADNQLHMPNNQRQGPLQFCDHWALGKHKAIDALADAVHDFDTVFQKGCPYNAELMVGTILKDKGIVWPSTTWNSTLKYQGWNDPNTGMWHPDLGRWILK